MRARVLVGGVASAAATATILCLPGLSIGALSDSGGGSDQTVTVKPSKPSSTPLREARQSQAVPPGYIPPLHGSNPHGQGTVGTIDLTPGSARPIPVDPVTGEALAPNREEVVVGRSRGEQRADGTYHGHITILSLFGNEVVGVDSNEGETKDGPLQSIQQGVLNPLCTSSGGAICLTVLRAHSATQAGSPTQPGFSKNEFKAVDLSVGSGGGVLTAKVAESHGNIETDLTTGCQTARGDSLVTDAAVGGATGPVKVKAASSSSDSQACRAGVAPDPKKNQNTSSVILEPPLLQPVPDPRCAAGEANIQAGLAPLLPIICNADDRNGNQTADPYGVREALTVFALVAPPNTGLLKVTAAASESHAVAPPAGPGPDGPGPADDDADRRPADDGPDGEPDRGDRAGDRAGPAGPAAAAANNALAFTGADLLIIALSGTIMLAAGLALRSAVSRSPRRAA